MTPRAELQTRFLLEMNANQMRHALAWLIREFEGDSEKLEKALVAGYDVEDEPARGGIVTGRRVMVGEDGPEAIVPLAWKYFQDLGEFKHIRFDAGTLHLPVIMWTADERDTPKMIVETLCVAQAAMNVYENVSHVSPEYVRSHNERIARLLESARRGVQ